MVKVFEVAKSTMRLVSATIRTLPTIPWVRTQIFVRCYLGEGKVRTFVRRHQELNSIHKGEHFGGNVYGEHFGGNISTKMFPLEENILR